MERPEMVEKLLTVLDPVEPRTLEELLTRLGLSTGRKVAGVGAVALRELRARGLARSHGSTQPLRWLSMVQAEGAERHPLPQLDATLVVTSTTRTTAGGTRRTDLVAVVELGPSWPDDATLPPRWSTALSDAQVAAGGLAGARHNAQARAEAQLRALRARKTLIPLPTETPMDRPSPLLIPSKKRNDFLEYLASIDRGARQDSACARLSRLGLASTTDEAVAWLDEAVKAGVIVEHRVTASDGTTVVRYQPADPSTAPAPLPKSDAPAEAPAAPPVTVSPLAEEAPEEGESESLKAQLEEAEQKIKVLNWKVEDWERRYNDADRASAQHLAELKAERDQLRAQVEAASAELRASPVYQPDPAEAFAGGVASWLMDLSDDDWREVLRARHQMAEARRLREQSHQLKQSALDALDRLVGGHQPPASDGAPEPPRTALSLVAPPEPTPAPPASEPPPSSEPSEPPHPLQCKVWRQVLAGLTSAGPIAKKIGEEQHKVSSVLSALSLAGWIVRTRPGQYAPGRRAA